jgi:4-carboxymuconolactone decarboxylase
LGPPPRFGGGDWTIRRTFPPGGYSLSEREHEIAVIITTASGIRPASEREQVVYKMAIGLPNAGWARRGLRPRQGISHVDITHVITLIGHYTSISMTLAFYNVPAGAPGMAR